MRFLMILCLFCVQATNPDTVDSVFFSTSDPRFQISGNGLSLSAGNAFDYEVIKSTSLRITARSVANHFFS